MLGQSFHPFAHCHDWLMRMSASLLTLGGVASADTPASLEATLDARLAQHTALISAELQHLHDRLDLIERQLDVEPSPSENSEELGEPATPPAHPTITISIPGEPLPDSDDGQTVYTITATGWPAGQALTVWGWSQASGGNIALGHGRIQQYGSERVQVTLQDVLPGAVVLIADVHPANLPPDPDRDGIRARHRVQRIAVATDRPNDAKIEDPTLLAGLPNLKRITIDQVPLIRSGSVLSGLVVDARGGPGIQIPPGTRDVVLERVYVFNAGGGSYIDSSGRKQWHYGTAGFTLGRGCKSITLRDCGNFDSAGGPGHGRRMQGVYIAVGCSDISILRFVGQNIHGPENKAGEVAGLPYTMPYDDQFSHLIYAIDVTGLTVHGAALIGGDGQIVKVAGSKPGGSSGVRLRGLLGVWNSAIAMTGPTDNVPRDPGLVTDYRIDTAALVDPDGWNATQGTSSVWGFWALGTRAKDCRVDRIGRYQYNPANFQVGFTSGDTRPTIKPIVEEAQRVTIGDDVADAPDRVVIADIPAMIAAVRDKGYGDWCDAGVLLQTASDAK